MKRKYIPIDEAIRQAREKFGYPKTYGICACYFVEDMGFCKDRVSRWYQFTDVNGDPAYTIKR